MSVLPISGIVITCNEADNIKRCLESMSFCSELLVVDSGSVDDTAARAHELGARVIRQDWLGFGPQKQFAVEQASHDWVICIDADEWLSPELARAIEALLHAGPDAVGYSVPRRNFFLGRPMRFGGGYPDRKLRLFDRRHARWSEDAVHEQVVADGRVEALNEDLMHDTAADLDQATAKWARYASQQASAMHREGARAGIGQLVFNPVARFFKLYILKQGFRDGRAGFAMAVFSAFFCFFKYLQLARLARSKAPRAP